MKANYLDFKKNMKNIIKALELNEPVEIYYRGKKKGTIIPEKTEKKEKNVRNGSSRIRYVEKQGGHEKPHQVGT
ncbi:MAG TPA: hypothetical protein P5511_00370 [Candidatus Goldiibacteriota bacterium]|nr:hypothetical protein [Candidatus Goldiibacteriota bacterium]